MDGATEDAGAMLATPARTMNWSRIDAWTAFVLANDIAPIAEVFESAGAGTPEVHLSPRPEQISAEALRFLVQRWYHLRASGSSPHLRHIDPFALRPALGYLMVLEPVDGGRDFRYRLFGSSIARISGFDMTGRKLSEHPARAYVSEFGIAVCRASLRGGQPIYSTRHPVGAEFTTCWHRLALPFVDDAGVPARILGGTVPVDAGGRVIRG